MIPGFKHLADRLYIFFTFVLICGCSQDTFHLRYALKAAGENKSELIAVLHHYRIVDRDAEKLKAARFLIANMPAHYSYLDTAMANRFYAEALKVLKSGRDAAWQRDTIRLISEQDFPDLRKNIVSDVKIMTADYLIYSIDHAFNQWRTRPWAKHLTYEEFREWLLPYKVAELQSFDAWRDTLSAHFSDSISHLPIDNDQCYTIYGALDIVRNEMVKKLNPYIAWTTTSGYPLLSAETMAYTTYGSCLDYVTLGTAVFRSVGLPTVIDDVPIWGRNHEGHTWYTILTDNNRQIPAQHDITIPAGWGFFPYQRFPKIFRLSYAIDWSLVKYYNTANHVYTFNLCKHDITEQYYRTTDVSVPLKKEIRLKDKYVYIATPTNSGGPQWFILDYGIVRKKKAYFSNMGRELLYMVLGYDGKNIVPISDPFIIHKDGSVEYIHFDDSTTRTIEVKRKYFESYNVVEQRRKILGAKIQCADHADFNDSITLYTINRTDIPDKVKIDETRPHRYWRYLAADGTFGSIAEIAFFDSIGTELNGTPIGNNNATTEELYKAFDNNWLSNFETEEPNGNWVGMDMNQKKTVATVRVVPRSDDNDVCPGNEYELLYWDGKIWNSLGCKIAMDNKLEYENVPSQCLLWLKNYTRGWAERAFIIRDDNSVEWY